jgi:hypothetical protein
MKPREWKESLPVPLTLDEREKLAFDCLQIVGQVEEMETQKRNLPKQIESAWDRLIQLKEQRESGVKLRPVDCEERPDFEKGVMNFVRLDTGVVFDSRPLKPEERNGNLFANESVMPGSVPAKSDAANVVVFWLLSRTGEEKDRFNFAPCTCGLERAKHADYRYCDTSGDNAFTCAGCQTVNGHAPECPHYVLGEPSLQQQAEQPAPAASPDQQINYVAQSELKKFAKTLCLAKLVNKKPNLTQVYAWAGDNLVCVAKEGDTLTGYKLIRENVFEGAKRKYSELEDTGNGFYHGLVVFNRGWECVLVGPPVVFRDLADAPPVETVAEAAPVVMCECDHLESEHGNGDVAGWRGCSDEDCECKEFNAAVPIAPEQLQMMLSLVIEDEIPLDLIESWTPAQRLEAERWAALSHLNANDHDDVEVPPLPLFLIKQAVEAVEAEQAAADDFTAVKCDECPGLDGAHGLDCTKHPDFALLSPAKRLKKMADKLVEATA